MPLRFATTAIEAYDYPLTISHLHDAALICAPDQEIVYSDQVRLSYRELRAPIHQLATMLTALGTGTGTTVAVIDWDNPHCLECYFAILMIVATLEIVSVRLPAAQIAYNLAHAKAEILLVHRDLFAMAGKLVLRTPWLTLCYESDASASVDLLRGGSLHTQNIATIYPQGNIGIRDLLKMS
jgi:fatty-acyl-CoA synthase